MKLAQLCEVDILVEDVESKLPHLIKILTSPKSQWLDKDSMSPEETVQFIRSLADWDPTGERGVYVPFIVKQIVSGKAIIHERGGDGPELLDAIEKFESGKKSNTWPLPKDINQIDDWHKIAEVEGDFASKRSVRRAASKGYEIVFELTVPMKSGDQVTYKITKITEPEAARNLGKGTTWCTTQLSGSADNPPTFTYPAWHKKSGQSRPLIFMPENYTDPRTGVHHTGGYANQAANYLQDGPLWIIFRGTAQGKVGRNEGPGCDDEAIGRCGQIAQLSEKSGESKFQDNSTIMRCSDALDYLLGSWAQADSTAPFKLIKQMRSMCLKVDDQGNVRPNNYEGRPPMVG